MELKLSVAQFLFNDEKRKHEIELIRAVDDGNIQCRRADGQEFAHRAAVKAIVHHAVYRADHQHTDDVESRMDDRSTLAVLGGADGGQRCADTGTDILPHDDRHCRRIADRTGHGQRP